MSKEKIVVTGMSVITPIGDTLDEFYKNLIKGKSGISLWKRVDTARIYSKVGGDLYDYDIEGQLETLGKSLPEEIYQKAKKLFKNAPWNTKLTILATLKAYLDANMSDWPYDPYACATIIPGHNLNRHYEYHEHEVFNEEPDFMDSSYSIRGLDTDHAGTVSELINFRGAAYTIGAACASGNVGLKLAIDEIRNHGMEAAIVVAPVFDYSALELQGLCLIDAISYLNFNDKPEKASRPYDVKREGFVPSHGVGALVIEKLSSALKREATIYAEVCAVEASADACHLPQPSADGQARLIKKVLKIADIAPEQIDFISAHATSTPVGDITELNAIKLAFGKHAYQMKINAPKSMLGHTCWSSSTIEAVALILQMNNNFLHPSINIEMLDPRVDLNVCPNEGLAHEINYALNNSFGFGGINCISLFKKYQL